MVACQQTYVQNRTRVAKVASYETSQETSVSCTQLVVLYAPFQFGSEYNFLAFVVKLRGTFISFSKDSIITQDRNEEFEGRKDTATFCCMRLNSRKIGANE